MMVCVKWKSIHPMTSPHAQNSPEALEMLVPGFESAPARGGTSSTPAPIRSATTTMPTAAYDIALLMALGYRSVLYIRCCRRRCLRMKRNCYWRQSADPPGQARPTNRFAILHCPGNEQGSPLSFAKETEASYKRRSLFELKGH